LVDSLRKRTLKGQLYGRRPEVESEIGELLSLPEDAMLDRCGLARGRPGYVSTEAVLHLLRARRGQGDTLAVSRLFHLLSERVLHLLPKAEGPDGVSLSKEQIRERTFDRLTDLLLADRKGYDDRLDYYEINFNGALAKLRLTAQKQVWRDENRSTPLEASDEEVELSVEVEEAAGSYDPLSAEALDDARYRSRLDAAIDGLPPIQSRIIEMLRQGMPIDSQDPSVLTIRRTLGKAEKTVRNQRDKAFARLRIVLSGRGKV
jgi:hypothetical protein